MVEDSRASAPSGKRAERSRAAIVAAARELFISGGFDTGMDAIAAAAGVSKVTVYNHFGSKEELFTEVIGHAMGQAHTTMAEVRARLAETGDIRQALLVTARTMVASSTDPSRLALRNLVTGELRRFPALAESYREYGPARSAAGLADVLTDLCDRGQLVIGDIQIAVIQFFSLTIYPGLIQGTVGGSLDDDLTERLVTEGVDLFLSRYRPR